MKGLVNIDFKPIRSPKPKLNKLDTSKLTEDARLSRPIRLPREGNDNLESILGQPLQIKGSPKKILEVILGEKECR